MKFTVSIAEFQKALTKAQPALPRKSTLPVLEHFYFTVSDNTLSIIAPDQEITLMTKVNVECEEEGEILVPGRKLVEISKALSNVGSMLFSADMNNFEISLHVQGGDYLLKGLSSEEYLRLPELFESEKPQIPTVSDNPQDDENPVAFFDAASISYLANKTSFAVSSDEFRPNMNGVLFQFKETVVNVASTDSYRLVVVRFKKEGVIYPKELEVIIPLRGIEILKRVDDDVIMSFIRPKKKFTHVRFDIGDTIFISRVIDEHFPPFETVLPQNNNLILLVDQKELLNSLRRVSILTSTISNQVKFLINNNELTILGENEEVGEKCTEILPCEFNSDTYKIAFNIKYLTEVIQHIESEDDTNNKRVKFKFAEDSKPALVYPEDAEDKLVALVMPVRFGSRLG